MESTKVLFVDDEINILDGLKRKLRNRYELITAQGAEDALKIMQENRDSVGVVVSDMRMPGVDGASFLNQIRDKYPDTVRIMLTGNSDQTTAVKAVNEGSIFRFLCKPCETPDLEKALNDALRQRSLIVAEKELLNKTLTGSIKVLTEILSLVDPLSFAQAEKLRALIKLLAVNLEIENIWELELSAMLINIGNVVVPPMISKKVSMGRDLTSDEEQILEKVPEVGRNLIINIPRLESIAEIIYYHTKRFDGTGFPKNYISGSDIPYYSRLLKILKDLVELESTGVERTKALKKLSQRSGWYDLTILAKVAKNFTDNFTVSKEELEKYPVYPEGLIAGQILVSDVETVDGKLLITAGNVLTQTSIDRIINHSKLIGLKLPINVNCKIPLR